MQHAQTARTIRLAAAAVLACSTLAGAQERSAVSIEARLWTPDPSGTFTVIGGAPTENLDFKRDLGLDEDGAVEGQLAFRPSRRTLVRLGFLPELAIQGDQVVTRSITFLGQPFALSERIVTDLTFEYGRLGFGWMFISASNGKLRLGPLVEAKGFRGDLAISAPDSGIPVGVSESYEVAFGSAGVIAELEVGERVQLFAETTESITGDEGDVTETEYGVRVRVFSKLAVVAGVRTLEIDFTDVDEQFVFDLDGVFFSARASF